MTSQIKTRFCPSPTGLVHIGNIRTALFNALFAKRHHGTFLLRIEDTDKERSKPEYIINLQEDLKWLELRWNEGPKVGGESGPYQQSQRLTIYDEFYKQLELQALAYPCFCREEQLKITRKIQRSQGKPPRYPGTCRHLSKEQITIRLAKGEQAALRYKVDERAVITFTDLVRGQQTFYGHDMGDFIIRRSDGTPPFMFCNAIDDAMMGITHVLRGEDHLTNTPRQIMMLQALNLPVPQYAHISLIIGNDGAPLSKRTGSRSIQELRDKGFLPIAINNYLARLGHHYEDEVKLTSLAELANAFKVTSLGSAPARFDESQLLRWQKMAVSSLNQEDFWNWIAATCRCLIPNDKCQSFIKVIQPNVTFPAEAKRWAEIFFDREIKFNKAQLSILQEAGKIFFDTALAAIDRNNMEIKGITQELKEKCHVKGQQLFMPLRVAMTGEQHGPELAQIFTLLGSEKLKQRLEQVLQAIK